MISELKPSNQHSYSHKRRPLRVALLTNENTPYRVPLYRELAATQGWDFRVYTCVDREFDRLWNVTDTNGFITKKSFSLSYMRRQLVDTHNKIEMPRQVHLPVGIVPDMIKFRPDVVLSNEFGARTMLASLTAKLLGHRLIVYSESTPHTEVHSSRKQLAVRRLLSGRPDAYICNGKESRYFLENLGVDSQDIFEVGQALDLESFDHPYAAVDREKLRQQWKITGVCYLFVGHLTKHKGTIQLLEAWRVFCESAPMDATLLMAGEGEERKRLEAIIVEGKLRNVKILGFVQRKELAKIYSAADVFVFPTLKDCFSLAFEEGMAAGLPVIGSPYGGESELVVEGENGWVADPLKQDELVSKLRLAYDARPELPAMGQRARQAVSRMGIEKVAARIRLVVDHTLENLKKRSLR